jgi:small nuclear ribonucleoprotein (snRNP)-like protein
MEGNGWMDWKGKKVFIILKNNKNYEGVVKKVEINPPLVWITILDKFKNLVLFSAEEITMMKEEDER